MIDTTNALVSLEDAKDFLKISVESEDSIIESMINRASSWANSYTQRLLLSRVNTDYYDGDGTGTLILNQYPVTTLTSLYDDVDRAFGAGTAINVGSDVVLDGDNGLIRLFNQAVAFNKGILNVKAVYTAGVLLVCGSGFHSRGGPSLCGQQLQEPVFGPEVWDDIGTRGRQVHNLLK